MSTGIVLPDTVLSAIILSAAILSATILSATILRVLRVSDIDIAVEIPILVASPIATNYTNVNIYIAEEPKWIGVHKWSVVHKSIEIEVSSA